MVIGDCIEISRSWLRQQLHQSEIDRQIIILDCPGAESLADWVEDLRLESQIGQCLIAGAATLQNSEEFAQVLLKALEVADSENGLPVAKWIVQIHTELAESKIWWDASLSATQGVIEILPPGEKSAKPVDVGLCPYMGLRAFGVKDAKYFYGREDLTQRLINELSQRSFLPVVGASGSGKSSVVRAGLIAQLQQGKQIPGSEQWLIKSFRPGKHPIQALASALVDAGTEEKKNRQQMEIEGLLHFGGEGFVRWLRQRTEPMVVLLVDQFEELFTLQEQETSKEHQKFLDPERQSFLDMLLEALEYAADKFKLVITLRADFIASCLKVRKLYEKLQQSYVLVPPSLDDYRQVIVKPAEKVGLEVEPELVEELLQQMNDSSGSNDSSGNLPILELVLETLWEKRQRGKLTLQVYWEKIGGLEGALDRKAKAVYESLDAEAQACAQ